MEPTLLCDIITRLILSGETNFQALEGAAKSVGVNFGRDVPQKSFAEVWF